MPGRVKYPGAASFVPPEHDLASLRRAARTCLGCDLAEPATQTVFGALRNTDDTAAVRLVLVGEQPGDREDVQGAPFVGPAGGVLDQALEEAGLDAVPTYVTNAVKHFRWKATAGSTRRLHQTPSAGQSTACRPWLAAELHSIGPTVLVALGATAATSLFGPAFRLTQHRGEVLAWPPETGPFAASGAETRDALATVHPSAVLRAPDDERRELHDGLVRDLRLAGERLGGPARS